MTRSAASKEKAERELPPFALKLKALRQAAGLSQSQLAEKAGLHPMALSKLEQGQRGPAWDTVQALAKALGTTCEVFQTDAVPAKPTAAKKPRKQ